MESITGRSIFSREGIRLILNNGYIEAIEKAAIPADAPYLSFGFYDIQVNGFAGYDYNTAGLKVEHVREIVKLLVASGTTQHLPTIITNSNERIISNLRIIAERLLRSQLNLQRPYQESTLRALTFPEKKVPGEPIAESLSAIPTLASLLNVRRHQAVVLS